MVDERNRSDITAILSLGLQIPDLFCHATDWTELEKSLLLAALRKVAANDGFWPDEETMQAAHSAVSVWAPEIVLIRELPVRKVYIGLYEGGAGFPPGTTHIFGGYNRFPEPNIQASIDRIGKREIGGAKIIFDRVIGHRKWTSDEHPYGHPLSIYCLCRAEGAVPEDEKHWFAGMDELPVTLVGPHMRFARALLTAPSLDAFYYSDESV